MSSSAACCGHPLSLFALGRISPPTTLPPSLLVLVCFVFPPPEPPYRTIHYRSNLFSPPPTPPPVPVLIAPEELEGSHFLFTFFQTRFFFKKNTKNIFKKMKPAQSLIFPYAQFSFAQPPPLLDIYIQSAFRTQNAMAHKHCAKINTTTPAPPPPPHGCSILHRIGHIVKARFLSIPRPRSRILHLPSFPLLPQAFCPLSLLPLSGNVTFYPFFLSSGSVFPATSLSLSLSSLFSRTTHRLSLFLSTRPSTPLRACSTSRV